jgi:hypothetical protein
MNNIDYVETRPRFHDHVYYSKDLDDSELADLPVLGILHFTFQPGVDVSHPQQCPATVLWKKSLKYVSTIPGFERLFWSPVNDNDASSCQQVVVLIQWKGVSGWRHFQISLGFSMMLGYITEASNRCIQHTLPPEIPRSCYLELVSFRFPNGKTNFKAEWDSPFSLFNGSALAEAGLLHASGEWLERDIDTEDYFFAGLLFWNSGTGVGNRSILAGHITSLVENGSSTVSVYTSELRFVSADDASILQSSDPFTGCEISKIRHAAFQKPVHPRYSLDEDISPGCKDIYHKESMRLARIKPPERIAAGPAGVWYMASNISQHHIPRHVQFNKPVADINMISFRIRGWNQRLRSSFEALRMRLWKLGDCPFLSWGEDPVKEKDWTNILLYIGKHRILYIMFNGLD